MAGIYVHVPFCHAKCAYCDFYSVAGDNFKKDYAAAVVREWQARRSELGAEAVKTVYFGGGTPSSLSPDLLGSIVKSLPLDRVEEFSIEVNPEDVCDESARAWRAMGINRVSMGVQSLRDNELLAVGRRHSARRALDAVATLRAAGFDNISCDLIYGLPEQTLASWKESVTGLLATGIEHLSAYCLSFEEGTLLYRRMKAGDVVPASEELLCDMYHFLCQATRDAGFVHYEISNFAKPGFESRHNSSYWDRTPYLGLGPGAHSLDCTGIRRYVAPGLSAYCRAPESAAVVDEETDTERLNDLIFISLRTARGLDISLFDDSSRRELLKAARPMLSAGHLSLDGDVLSIPEQHWLVSDAVIRDLLF